MSPRNESASPKALLVIGPKRSRISPQDLVELRSDITQTPELGYLKESVASLELLWPAIVKACPQSEKINGLESLSSLNEFLAGGELSRLTKQISQHNNFLVDVVTILLHIIEFWRLATTKIENVLFSSRPDSFGRLQDIQGFCLGFLTAAAVSSSSDLNAFRKNSTTALRIAVSIGALVEADAMKAESSGDRAKSLSVDWNSLAEWNLLNEILSTHPDAYIACITDKSLAGGLSIQGLNFEGRYHCQGAYLDGARELAEMFKQDPRFQLPNATDLVLPLRSNIDGELISEGALHEIALNCILLEQCQWYETVNRAAAYSAVPADKIIRVGVEAVVPRSLTKSLLPNGASNTVAHVGDDQLDDGSSIAVIGMACRYPDADSLEEFWELISTGKSAVSPLSADRFSMSEVTREPKNTFWGNFLRSVDQFDHRFFGISGREAKYMDPQQRLVLQVAYEALESAGYFGIKSSARPFASDIGCYLGVGSVDYGDNIALQDATAFSALGTLRAFISGRISHFFGWSGPSITYDTACSSGAVAIHAAVNAIKSNECSAALAGGVNVITSPALFQNLAAASFLSPTGASKAFDASADGYCRGEGAGLVLLKSLERARADGDSILAIITGSAVNQGSNCTPITVPVSESQSTLYEKALSISRTNPKDVSYVEAHGTGTPVGDPIECESIRKTFGGRDRKHELFLGSVKDNIGHTEAASGAAALIKTILMFQKREVPKQANFSQLNPKISPLEPDHMTIPRRTQKWNAPKRIAVVNNYGAAGSNAAIVVQESGLEYNMAATNGYESIIAAELPFFISAKTADSLRQYCSALSATLPNIAKVHGIAAVSNLAYNLAAKSNREFRYSYNFIASTLDEVATNLLEAHSVDFSEMPEHQRPVVLCIARCSKSICFGQLTALVIAGGLSLVHGLRFVSERARLIQSFWGQETGAMLSVQGDNSTLDQLIEITKSHYPSLIAEVACYNGQQTRVLAGDGASIDAVEETAKTHNFSRRPKVVRLKSTHAFHSSFVDDILPDLRKVAATLDFQKPLIRIEACSQDQDWNHPIDAETLAQHSRMPVYFYNAIQRIAARLGPCVFLEAGSASPIVSMARQTLTAAAESDSKFVFQAIEIGPADSIGKLAKATSNLWAAGVRVQYWPFHHHQKGCFGWINLPPYQFQKSTHWLEYVATQSAKTNPTHPKTADKEGVPQLLVLNARNAAGISTFLVDTMHEMFKYCTEGHAVLGQSLCPASMYVELAIRAADYLRNNKLQPKAPCVRELKISSPLSISPASIVLLQLHPINNESDVWKFTVLSQGQSDAATSIKHATGIVSLLASEKYFDNSHLQFIQRLISQDKRKELADSPGSQILNGHIVYQVFGQVVNYANYYRGVCQIASNGANAVGLVNVPGTQPMVMSEARCDPIILDNFLQVAGIHVNCLSERDVDQVFVCTELAELYLSDTFLTKRRDTQSYKVYTSFHQGMGKTLVNDIFVLDSETDDLLVLFQGAIFHSVPMKSLARTLAKLNNRNSTSAAQQDSEMEDQNPVKTKLSLVASKSEDHITDEGKYIATDLRNTGCGALTFSRIRELLSRVIEVSIEDIKPTTTLADLGIDSLMSTEILNEVKNQFDFVIPAEQFLALEDVQSFVQLLNPGEAPTIISRQQATTYPLAVGQSDLAASFAQVQELLSNLLGVLAQEIAADTPLADLGIDSLMATEVLSEIHKKYGVTILAEEFQKFDNVLAITTRIQTLAMLSAGDLTPPLSCDEMGQADGNTDVIHVVNKNQDIFASIAQNSFLSVKRDFDSILRSQKFADFYERVYPAQMQLVITYIVEAFEIMGCPLTKFSPGDAIPDISVLGKHQKVKHRLYQILEDGDLIKQGAKGSFVRTATPIRSESSARLHQAIIVNFPQHTFEHNLLASTGAKLAECLTGRNDPLAILFGTAKARTLMENVYTHAPMFKAGTVNLTRYMVRMLETIPGTRPISILELGAGTGGTTKHLLECLVATRKDVQYTFTDLSASLVSAARKKFAQYDFMRYAVMNIEEDPASQFLNKYDIVISTNCIHATRDLTRSCTNIRKCLRPDGVLCLVELTRNLFWFDLVFGLLEGWWLFEDGREHALASETLWQSHLSRSGFSWTDWTVGVSEESNILRVITASPSNSFESIVMETVPIKRIDDVLLEADIYYPEERDCGNQARPVALMIHGGGHVMLSRKDIRPPQTRILLEAGFLPVSIDYRLCPEVTLLDGPMQDVCDALDWSRRVLPQLPRRRRDVRVDGDRVVAVGWSTGGHLALTLGFTAPLRSIRPPEAILAFYCPTDYEDSFWKQPNFPFGLEADSEVSYDLLEGVYDHPITAYNPTATKRALGGWMSQSDPRSRIALHMNWTGRYLQVLLRGLSGCHRARAIPGADPTDTLRDPSQEEIQAVSPLAQIRRGVYRVPTFIIHGTKDDLIPWQQAVRTYESLQQQGVAAEIRILEGAVHLFDLYRSFESDERSRKAVHEGYEFLHRHVV
ncbi:hypothetical protein TruAng_003183 [Truncatella angustata]|nr:hypothetical protein TruAng_003183 [Truncatella angustata]